MIGSGGREHAIVHALTKSPQIEQVYTSPGNYGTGQISSTATCQCTNVPHMSAEETIFFVQQHDVSLVIVGPERPLVDGLSDQLVAKVHLFLFLLRHVYGNWTVSQTIHIPLAYGNLCNQFTLNREQLHYLHYTGHSLFWPECPRGAHRVQQGLEQVLHAAT